MCIFEEKNCNYTGHDNENMNTYLLTYLLACLLTVKFCNCPPTFIHQVLTGVPTHRLFAACVGGFFEEMFPGDCCFFL